MDDNRLVDASGTSKLSLFRLQRSLPRVPQRTAGVAGAPPSNSTRPPTMVITGSSSSSPSSGTPRYSPFSTTRSAYLPFSIDPSTQPPGGHWSDLFSGLPCHFFRGVSSPDEPVKLRPEPPMRAVIVALVVVLVFAGMGASKGQTGSQTAAAPAMYFCPMHPDVTDKVPGACSRCGMKLVPGDPWNEREYLLDLKMEPPAPKPGAPTRFRLTVLHPESKAPVREFAVVHDKRFHLFV